METEFLLQLAGISIIYLIAVTFPFWYPILSIKSDKIAFKQSLSFGLTIGLLTYGSITFLTFLLILPFQVLANFIVPSFNSDTEDLSNHLLSILDIFDSYWWLINVFVLIVISIFFTKKLKNKWPFILKTIQG